MLKIGTILAFLTLSLFGSDGGETDIIERSVNFLIFATIVYLLVAEPLKRFLTERTLKFENQFKANQAKLEESKIAKERAEEEFADAQKQAGLIIADAKKESKLIIEKLNANFEKEVQVLEKQQEDLKELEERKMVKSVIDEVIRESIKGNVGLDNDSLIKTLIKKVS